MPDSKERRKRRRWGDSTASATGGNGAMKPTQPLDAKAKTAALQQSISERLAALKKRKAQALEQVQQPPKPSFGITNNDLSNVVPPSKKAKVYDLDLSVTAPTFRKPKNEPPKKKVNPYLAHLEQEASDKTPDPKSKLPTQPDGGGELLMDSRLAGGHMGKKRRKKEIAFVEPGTFIQLAERKREKAENAAKSGFVSGRKVGTFVKSAGIADISKNDTDNYYGHTSTSTIEDSSTWAKSVPRVDTVGETVDGSSKSTGGVVVIPIPLFMEWWDVDLLPSKLKKEVITVEGKAITRKASQRMQLKGSSASGSGKSDISNEKKKEQADNQDLVNRCFSSAAIQHSKTWKLLQHPVPVKPPNAPKEDAPAPTLHLTKKEMKRQRKLRRAEKQRELQDMQAAGLIPAPEPKLTLSNFMRVLGDQAIMDPSKMEARVMEQIQARKLKHEKMNEERKLTKEQRAEKRDRKLTEDTSEAVSVALFLVKDMSHRYHRTKVDLNAQQNKITGGVLECEVPKMSLVICEGGPKAIKRYTRLMTVRMKWKGEGILDIEESDDEDATGENGDEERQRPQKFNPENSCDLVWTGMAPKRMFRSFIFQSCESSEDARKVLEAKGVAHFWDQVLVHASGSGENFNFKLGG